MGAVVVLMSAAVMRVRMGVRVSRGVVVMALRVRVIMTVIVPRIFIRHRCITQWGVAVIVRAGSGFVRMRGWAGHGQL